MGLRYSMVWLWEYPMVNRYVLFFVVMALWECIWHVPIRYEQLASQELHCFFLFKTAQNCICSHVIINICEQKNTVSVW